MDNYFLYMWITYVTVVVWSLAVRHIPSLSYQILPNQVMLSAQSYQRLDIV